MLQYDFHRHHRHIESDEHRRFVIVVIVHFFNWEQKHNSIYLGIFIRYSNLIPIDFYRTSFRTKIKYRKETTKNTTVASLKALKNVYSNNKINITTKVVHIVRPDILLTKYLCRLFV